MGITFEPQQSARINFAGARQAQQTQFDRQAAVYGQALQELGPRGFAALAHAVQDPGMAEFMRRLGLGDVNQYLTFDPSGQLSLDGMTPAQKIAFGQYVSMPTTEQVVTPGQTTTTEQVYKPGTPAPVDPNRGAEKNPDPGQFTLPMVDPVSNVPAAAPPPQPAPPPAPAPPPTPDPGPAFEPNTSWAMGDNKLAQELLEEYNRDNPDDRVMTIDELATRIGWERLTNRWEALAESSRDPDMADAERQMGAEISQQLRAERAAGVDRPRILDPTRPATPDPTNVPIDLYGAEAARSPVEPETIPDTTQYLGEVVFRKHGIRPDQHPNAFAAQLDAQARAYGFQSAQDLLRAYQATYGTLPPNATDAQGVATPFRGLNFITTDQIRELQSPDMDARPFDSGPPPNPDMPFSSSEPFSTPRQSTIGPAIGGRRADAFRTDAREVPGTGAGVGFQGSMDRAPDAEALERRDRATTRVESVEQLSGRLSPTDRARLDRVREQVIQSPTRDRGTILTQAQPNGSSSLVVVGSDDEVTTIDVPPQSRKLAKTVADIQNPTLPEAQRTAAGYEFRRQVIAEDGRKTVRTMLTSPPVVEQVTRWSAGPGREQFAAMLNQAERLYEENPAQAASIYGGVFASRLEADLVFSQTQSEVARARQLTALTNRAIEETKKLEQTNELNRQFIEAYSIEQLVDDQRVQAEVDRLQNDLTREFARRRAQAETEVAELGPETQRVQNRYTTALTNQLREQIRMLAVEAAAAEGMEEEGKLSWDQMMALDELELARRDALRNDMKLIHDLMGEFPPDSEIAAQLRSIVIEEIGGLRTQIEQRRRVGDFFRRTYEVTPAGADPERAASEEELRAEVDQILNSPIGPQ